uniref:Transposase-associated domain-containing protein n=1 Tax=Oryza rufipogon TaxID=4529 RepID=A0A0E0P4T9_ORYRU
MAIYSSTKHNWNIMDKGWMKASRSSIEYNIGVNKFIDFALSTSASDNRILCPCKTCGNRYWLGEHEVREHLICDGFLAGYTSWIHHGESMLNSKPSDASSSHCEEHNDDMDQMLLDGLGMTRSLGKASAGSLSAIKFSNTQVLTTSRF